MNIPPWQDRPVTRRIHLPQPSLKRRCMVIIGGSVTGELPAMRRRNSPVLESSSHARPDLIDAGPSMPTDRIELTGRSRGIRSCERTSAYHGCSNSLSFEGRHPRRTEIPTPMTKLVGVDQGRLRWTLSPPSESVFVRVLHASVLLRQMASLGRELVPRISRLRLQEARAMATAIPRGLSGLSLARISSTVSVTWRRDPTSGEIGCDQS